VSQVEPLGLVKNTFGRYLFLERAAGNVLHSHPGHIKCRPSNDYLLMAAVDNRSDIGRLHTLQEVKFFAEKRGGSPSLLVSGVDGLDRRHQALTGHGATFAEIYLAKASRAEVLLNAPRAEVGGTKPG
jgi:hypothetical protein